MRTFLSRGGRLKRTGKNGRNLPPCVEAAQFTKRENCESVFQILQLFWYIACLELRPGIGLGSSTPISFPQRPLAPSFGCDPFEITFMQAWLALTSFSLLFLHAKFLAFRHSSFWFKLCLLLWHSDLELAFWNYFPISTRHYKGGNFRFFAILNWVYKKPAFVGCCDIFSEWPHLKLWLDVSKCLCSNKTLPSYVSGVKY